MRLFEIIPLFNAEIKLGDNSSFIIGKLELLNKVQKTRDYVGISIQVFRQGKREDYYEII